MFETADGTDPRTIRATGLQCRRVDYLARELGYGIEQVTALVLEAFLATAEEAEDMIGRLAYRKGMQ